jgi:eukaryotic-like serine/threonine-protein kinase
MFCPDCGTWNRAVAVQCARCGDALPAIPGSGGAAGGGANGAAAEAPDPELTTLRRLTGNRYRIVRRIGSGGMAQVYYAEHVLLGSPRVIKVLNAHLSREAEMRERFRREAEAAAHLAHPFICSILDYGVSDEAVYVVMPYLPNGSLADRLSRDRTAGPAFAATAAAQVACALDHAHRHGVVHRDIKPDNILFDEDGFAVVTDFGIATARRHGRLTGTGRAMGTPHYMSPEQAMGKMVDGRSDLYAVGVVLYEMLLGFPPFDGADSYSIGYKHVHETPVAPDIVDSRTPAGLSSVIMQCLEKDPAARYQHGNDLADALIAFVRETTAAGDTQGATVSRSAWLARRGATPSVAVG